MSTGFRTLANIGSIFCKPTLMIDCRGWRAFCWDGNIDIREAGSGGWRMVGMFLTTVAGMGILDLVFPAVSMRGCKVWRRSIMSFVGGEDIRDATRQLCITWFMLYNRGNVGMLSFQYSIVSSQESQWPGINPSYVSYLEGQLPSISRKISLMSRRHTACSH